MKFQLTGLEIRFDKASAGAGVVYLAELALYTYLRLNLSL